MAQECCEVSTGCLLSFSNCAMSLTFHPDQTEETALDKGVV